MIEKTTVINGLQLSAQIDETLANLRQKFDPSKLTKEEKQNMLQQIEKAEQLAHEILAKSSKKD